MTAMEAQAPAIGPRCVTRSGVPLFAPSGLACSRRASKRTPQGGIALRAGLFPRRSTSGKPRGRHHWRCQSAESKEREKRRSDLQFVSPTWYAPIILKPEGIPEALGSSVRISKKESGGGGEEGKKDREKESHVSTIGPEARGHAQYPRQEKDLEKDKDSASAEEDILRGPKGPLEGDHVATGSTETVGLPGSPDPLPMPPGESLEEESSRPSEGKGADVADTHVTYALRLGTSTRERSGISSSTGGIQVAIIGQSGRAISTRVYPVGPDSSRDELEATLNEDEKNSLGDSIYIPSGDGSFQEGAQAIVCLQGIDVRPVAALWVAPLADAWRLAEASLGVIVPGHANKGNQNPVEINNTQSPPSEGALGTKRIEQETSEVEGSAKTDGREGSGDKGEGKGIEIDDDAVGKMKGGIGSLYVFRPDESEVLGSSGDALAVELRPVTEGECTEEALLSLLEGSSYLMKVDSELDREAERMRKELEKQEGMEEYERLKEWLLLATAAIVVIGTFVATQVGGDSTGAAFAAGGLGSMLFLLKIQRQVDLLPSPDSISPEKRSSAALDLIASSSPVVKDVDREKAVLLDQLGGSKIPAGSSTPIGPIVVRAITVGLCFGAVLLLLNQSRNSGTPFSMTALPKIEPDQVVAAILGFLTHKVSVILAAFRRSPRSR